MSEFRSEEWMFMSGGFKADPVLMVRGNGNCIAVVHKGDGVPKSMERQRAEAALLAAAPKLLEALETLLLAVEVDKVKGIDHAISKGRAAVAKAKVNGFVHTPSTLLDAAKKIVEIHEYASENYNGQLREAGYLTGIGQAADLLRPYIAEAEGEA